MVFAALEHQGRTHRTMLHRVAFLSLALLPFILASEPRDSRNPSTTPSLAKTIRDWSSRITDPHRQHDRVRQAMMELKTILQVIFVKYLWFPLTRILRVLGLVLYRLQVDTSVLRERVVSQARHRAMSDGREVEVRDVVLAIVRECSDTKRWKALMGWLYSVMREQWNEAVQVHSVGVVVGVVVVGVLCMVALLMPYVIGTERQEEMNVEPEEREGEKKGGRTRVKRNALKK